MGAVIDLPKHLERWHLAVCGQSALISFNEWDAADEGDAGEALCETAMSGSAVAEESGSFTLPADVVPEFIYVLETVAGLALGRSELDDDGIWTVRYCKGKVVVEGPVEYVLDEDTRRRRIGTIQLPYAGLRELLSSLQVIVNCPAPEGRPESFSSA